jgi:hypothetical protein
MNIIYTKQEMADTIVDGTLFNAENIRYTSPKAGGSGGKSVNILNKSTNTGLRLSTPLMLTWGAADYVDEKTGKGNGKYEMSLVYPNDEYKDDDTTSFLTNMQNLEKKIKADALTNSKEWFGKVHKNAEVVDALYSPMLKYTKDKNTGEPDMSKSPLLKVKIPLWDGVWKCEVYDEDGAKLFPNPANPTVSPLDLIQKGSQVAVIMQCGGLWFANGKFGITWKLVQAMVQKPKTSLVGHCFIKLKSTDKEKLKKAPAPIEEADVDFPEPANTAVEESDDDEESEDEDDEPAPAPVVVKVEAPVAVQEEPKKVVKKVVKKKTDA